MSNPDEMRRQLLTHLRGLASAGGEWLPAPNLDMLPRHDAPQTIAPPTPPSSTPPPTVAPAEPAVPLLELVTDANDAGGPVMNESERRTALKTPAEEVKRCTRCAELCSTRTQTVFGQGEP